MAQQSSRRVAREHRDCFLAATAVVRGVNTGYAKT
jgi:hypothetical protein